MRNLAERIEILREMLNNEVKDGSLSNERILAASQELDEIIAEYYKDGHQNDTVGKPSDLRKTHTS